MTGATHVIQGKRTICDVILHSRVRINLQLSWLWREVDQSRNSPINILDARQQVGGASGGIA